MGVNTFLLKGGGLTIADMQSAAWDNSESKGFHEKDREVPLEYVIPTKLMLAVSELAESLEEVRGGKPLLYYGENGKPEGIAAELADVVIRCGDLAGILGIDLQAVVIEKMNFNEGRPHMHGGKTI
ncbi:MAG TPA: hypothetical protein VN843_24665 [Anaerolineales bacterium]|nr:hypothetical protein [Anaerolineales bacterium]